MSRLATPNIKMVSGLNPYVPLPMKEISETHDALIKRGELAIQSAGVVSDHLASLKTHNVKGMDEYIAEQTETVNKFIDSAVKDKNAHKRLREIQRVAIGINSDIGLRKIQEFAAAHDKTIEVNTAAEGWTREEQQLANQISLESANDFAKNEDGTVQLGYKPFVLPDAKELRKEIDTIVKSMEAIKDVDFSVHEYYNGVTDFNAFAEQLRKDLKKERKTDEEINQIIAVLQDAYNRDADFMRSRQSNTEELSSTRIQNAVFSAFQVDPKFKSYFDTKASLAAHSFNNVTLRKTTNETEEAYNQRAIEYKQTRFRGMVETTVRLEDKLAAKGMDLKTYKSLSAKDKVLAVEEGTTAYINSLVQNAQRSNEDITDSSQLDAEFGYMSAELEKNKMVGYASAVGAYYKRDLHDSLQQLRKDDSSTSIVKKYEGQDAVITQGIPSETDGYILNTITELEESITTDTIKLSNLQTQVDDGTHPKLAALNKQLETANEEDKVKITEAIKVTKIKIQEEINALQADIKNKEIGRQAAQLSYNIAMAPFMPKLKEPFDNVKIRFTEELRRLFDLPDDFQFNDAAYSAKAEKMIQLLQNNQGDYYRNIPIIERGKAVNEIYGDIIKELFKDTSMEASIPTDINNSEYVKSLYPQGLPLTVPVSFLIGQIEKVYKENKSAIEDGLRGAASWKYYSATDNTEIGKTMTFLKDHFSSILGNATIVEAPSDPNGFWGKLWKNTHKGTSVSSSKFQKDFMAKAKSVNLFLASNELRDDGSLHIGVTLKHKTHGNATFLLKMGNSLSGFEAGLLTRLNQEFVELQATDDPRYINILNTNALLLANLEQNSVIIDADGSKVTLGQALSHASKAPTTTLTVDDNLKFTITTEGNVVTLTTTSMRDGKLVPIVEKDKHGKDIIYRSPFEARNTILSKIIQHQKK